MRIVLVGQAAFGEQVLAGLVAAGHDIAAVYAPPTKAGGKGDPLAARAAALGLPLRTPAGYRSPEVAAEFRALGADLGLLAYVTRIVPPEVFEAPRLGTLCFHPSLLPRHRGGSAINWQIAQGVTRGGFTIFWTDPGIDTGPILAQEEVEIGPDDTAGSLYFDKIFARGVAAMVAAVAAVARGDAPRLAQDEAQATYEPLFTDEHAEIDWSLPTSRVYDRIRAADPQPGAFTWVGGEKLRLFDARKLDASSVAAPPVASSTAEQPGTVLRCDADGLWIAAGTGADRGVVRVGRVRLGGGAKVRVAEVASDARLAAGIRLGPVA